MRTPFSLRQQLNLLRVLAGRPAPIYVQLALSKRCNMRCPMCQAQDARRAEDEMDLGQLAHLAQVLRRMGVGFLILSGGEPLLRRDLPDVVAAFVGRGISVRPQSNGLLADVERLRRLRQAGLDGITFSLHSLDRQQMAHMTGVPDALERVLAALEAYAEVFPEPGHVRGVNTVVSRVNLDGLPRLIDFCDRIGFAVSLIPYHQAADTDFIVRGKDDGFAFGLEDHARLDAVWKQIRTMKRQGRRIYNSGRFLAAVPAFLKSGTVDWPCESPDLYFSISPSGIFLPCVDLGGEHSMLADDFLATWRRPAFRRRIRQQVVACSGCLYACYPEFSFMLHDRAHFIRRVFEYRRLRPGRRRAFDITVLQRTRIASLSTCQD